MIDTPSLSGCSGCPLFDGNKRLAAFVHGGVKHRGGRILHNNGDDDVTGYLFADSIADVSFLAVDSAFLKLLQIAEDIHFDLASNPTVLTKLHIIILGQRLSRMRQTMMPVPLNRQ